MKYDIENVCGGFTTVSKLSKAIEVASGYYSRPYITSKKGRRPIAEGIIGKWGQSYNDLVNDIQERF